MQLTESFYIENNRCNKDVFEKLSNWTRTAKNLYNQALYLVKKQYEQDKTFLWYKDLDKVMKTVTNLEGDINYRLMPSASSSQQVLRLVDRNVRSFLAALNDYAKYPNKYKGKPRFPKFLKKSSRFLLVFPGQRVVIKGNMLQLRKDFLIRIPDNQLRKELKVDCVRIVPVYGVFKVEIVYTIEEKELKQDNGKVLGIDLGISNFATCVSNTNNKPFILNGKELKSYNQNYNKRVAKLKSQLAKNIYSSEQIRLLGFNRKKFIENLFHLYTKRIIEFCLLNNINSIVIGRNKDWKQNTNMGKRNNQNFVSIPHYTFIQLLCYKCKLYGINFMETEEAYTSKTDHLANEPMKHQDSYLGKRKHRGLFQSSTGRLLNADVNGAIGIIRKVFGDSPVLAIVNRGLLYRPIRLQYSIIKDYTKFIQLVMYLS